MELSIERYQYQKLLVLIFFVLASGCAATPQSLELENASLDLPRRVELIHTPFYPQRDYQCGPAALATVINSYREITSPQALIEQVYVPELKGSLQVEVIAAARAHGLLALEQDGQLQSILREVAAGHPVLVLQNLGLEAYPFWHYAVVIGFDLDEQEIVLRSGERQRLVRPMRLFERTWQRAGHWSVIIVPSGVVPVTASEQAYLEAALVIDSLEVYRKGVERWPLSYELNFALGNRAYANQAYELAKQAFEVSTQVAPGRAAAWNNLGYAYWHLGKKDRAVESVEQALVLKPGDPNFLQSLQQISYQDP